VKIDPMNSLQVLRYLRRYGLPQPRVLEELTRDLAAAMQHHAAATAATATAATADAPAPATAPMLALLLPAAAAQLDPRVCRRTRREKHLLRGRRQVRAAHAGAASQSEQVLCVQLLPRTAYKGSPHLSADVNP
jgi:hypothetical protein